MLHLISFYETDDNIFWNNTRGKNRRTLIFISGFLLSELHNLTSAVSIENTACNIRIFRTIILSVSTKLHNFKPPNPRLNIGSKHA